MLNNVFRTCIREVCESCYWDCSHLMSKCSNGMERKCIFTTLVLGILIDMKHVEIRESICRYWIVLDVILCTLRLFDINYILKKSVKFLFLIINLFLFILSQPNNRNYFLYCYFFIDYNQTKIHTKLFKVNGIHFLQHLLLYK